MKDGVNREQIKKLLKIDYIIDNYLGIFNKNPIICKQPPTTFIPPQKIPITQQVKKNRRPSSAKPYSSQNNQTSIEINDRKVPNNKRHVILRNATQSQAIPQTSTNEPKVLKKTGFRTVSCQKITKKQTTLIKNRYEIVSVIGRGMSGSVYKAYDVLSQRSVAIKIIPPQCKQYFYIKDLDHQNIIKYYNSFIQKDKRYLILEYFPWTLQTLIRKRKLEEKEIKLIFSEIINAVIYMHGISIAHRDIKPDNIVISQDMKIVKFIDFGLCVDVSQQLHKQQKVQDYFCGTPNYIPPQVVKRTIYDARKADIWSLGVLLYVMTFGRYPFQGRDQSQTFMKIQTKKLIIPSNINQSHRILIYSMLEKNPDKRPTILQILKNQWLKCQ